MHLVANHQALYARFYSIWFEIRQQYPSKVVADAGRKAMGFIIAASPVFQYVSEYTQIELGGYAYMLTQSILHAQR